MELTDAMVVPDPYTDQDALELLLADGEWVQAEFAAIIRASGFGNRTIVGTIPHPPHRDRLRWARDAVCGGSKMTRRGPRTSISRVRSPPGR